MGGAGLNAAGEAARRRRSGAAEAGEGLSTQSHTRPPRLAAPPSPRPARTRVRRDKHDRAARAHVGHRLLAQQHRGHEVDVHDLADGVLIHGQDGPGRRVDRRVGDEDIDAPVRGQCKGDQLLELRALADVARRPRHLEPLPPQCRHRLLHVALPPAAHHHARALARQAPHDAQPDACVCSSGRWRAGGGRVGGAAAAALGPPTPCPPAVLAVTTATLPFSRPSPPPEVLGALASAIAAAAAAAVRACSPSAGLCSTRSALASALRWVVAAGERALLARQCAGLPSALLLSCCAARCVCAPPTTARSPGGGKGGCARSGGRERSAAARRVSAGLRPRRRDGGDGALPPGRVLERGDAGQGAHRPRLHRASVQGAEPKLQGAARPVRPGGGRGREGAGS